MPHHTTSASQPDRRSQITAEKRLLRAMGDAIADYNMIQDGDRIMVCLSGGKDSFTLLHLLHAFRTRTHRKFEIFSYTLDQSQPGWDDSGLRRWLETRGYSYAIERRNTYGVVIDKVPQGKTYCSLCSRLRRGNIYRFAKEHGFNKIALGHHRDDLIQSLLMSILYNGEVRSMPPKLLSDDRRHVVIRPLAYCKETNIIEYSELQGFPLVPCNLCGSQEHLARKRVKDLIAGLAAQNDKVPGNILNAIGNITPSQLMDHVHWDFRNLERHLEP